MMRKSKSVLKSHLRFVLSLKIAINPTTKKNTAARIIDSSISVSITLCGCIATIPINSIAMLTTHNLMPIVVREFFDKGRP